MDITLGTCELGGLDSFSIDTPALKFLTVWIGCGGYRLPCAFLGQSGYILLQKICRGFYGAIVLNRSTQLAFSQGDLRCGPTECHIASAHER